MSEILGLPARLAALERCLVMGVVNVTPDSFSDGGQWYEPQAAVAHGLRLVEQGADVLDVGGESTRPGAARVPIEEELRRVIPVVADLCAAGVMVSVDTMRAAVADAALSVGAAMINDVSGGLADPLMADLVSEAGVPFIAMHWRGSSDRMEELAVYDDVVADVVGELTARLHELTDRGVDPRQIVLDPGFGFAKKAHHNWELLAHLDRLLAIGRPLLVGTSRKRFLASAVTSAVTSSLTTSTNPANGSGGSAGSVQARDAATAATSALAAAAGAWGVRVHEVPPSADAVRVVQALDAARSASRARPPSGDLR